MRQIVIAALLSLVSSSVWAQECYQAHIGLTPVQPTLTLTQWNQGMTAASQIVRRAPNGTPSPTGKTYLLAIGMSNTEIVVKGLAAAATASGALRPSARIINGAYSGKTAANWANPNDTVWARLIGSKLANMGVSPAAISAVFIMVTEGFPTGSPSVNAALYAQHVRAIRANLTGKGFTNRKIDYLAANYYGGCDGSGKTPEPHGYEEGRILQQVQDQATGSIFVSAVPGYLWADGDRPRWDGLTLLPRDLRPYPDLVHLNEVGRQKYGQQLFDQLRDDPTTYGWLW